MSCIPRIGLLALVCAIGPLGLAIAQDNKTDDRGKGLYDENCARCHGAEGRGDGPDAGTTRVATADLTLIAARNEGSFPDAEIAKIIDGRRAIRVHGASGMPVWGKEFQADPSGGGPGEVVVKDRIHALIDYLKTLQQQPQTSHTSE